MDGASEAREHVAERFAWLLSLYRRPDGSEWGGADLEDATGGVVTRSYVSILKKGDIENPGILKLEAIAGAMGFAPELWFVGGSGSGKAIGEAVSRAVEDETLSAMLEEAMRLGSSDRALLLRIARQIRPRS